MRYRLSIFGVLLACGSIAALVAGAAAQDARHPLTAAPTGTFAITGDNPLFMPTGVAVADDGSVFVVDGVNDRVVQFSDDGFVRQIVHTVGDATLQRPISAHLDADHRLWIADTGNHRLVVRNPDGTLERTIRLPADALPAPVDLTDFALTPAGDAVWLVDNDHHQLIRYALASGQTRIVGREGESLGQFHYPFMIASASEGDLVLTDVINGRVQVLDREGRPARSVGTYGVRLGQFFRPKGVAIDSQGRIWVSDGTLNVVQVFTADGRLIDVVRDERGKPLKFALPMGLAFDAADHLYVVELQAHRVVKLDVRFDAEAPPATVTTERRNVGMNPQPQACTICHLEWVTPLADGRPTELIDLPPNPPEWPNVSRSDICLGCHDGSVGDARRRVWVEHGHQTGIAPPPSITVPDHMPLANGQIQCRTCHSAHTLPEQRTTFEEIVFLRVKNEPSELCMTCHADYVGGAGDGMHPLVDMDIALPQPLAHHAIAGQENKITCLACHSGHGSDYDSLLVLGVERNALCLSCHTELNPAVFAAEQRTAHGQLPALDANQRQTAARFDTKLGEGQTLACVTCHLSHNAPVKPHLLAFDPGRQDVCADCHPGQQAVVQSPHDLRTNHPEAINIRGITAAEGGACSGCHTAHQFAREVTPTAVDPKGQCVNCHATGQLASELVLGPVNHPESGCADCHEPHAADTRAFLKDQPFKLCTECHTDQQMLVGGPHDPATTKGLWPAEASATEDACLACHQPHGNEASGLFRVAWEARFDGPDASCLACHPDAASGTDSRIANQHPRNVSHLDMAQPLPVAQTAEGQTHINCNTCHNPHRGPEAGAHLLRVGTGSEPEQVCLTCHTERANIHTIGHAIEPIRAAGFEADACQPCHVAHGSSATTEAELMWPTSLNQFDGYAETRVPNQHCVSCHREAGPVAPPPIASHPEAQMFNPLQPDDNGYLPLFNAAGKVDPQGEIACRTCHLTHGRSDPAPVSAVLAAQGGRELRARQWHVRSFVGDNVCTTCHGQDGLRRFMYFHDAARRGGPIEGQ